MPIAVAGMLWLLAKPHLQIGMQLVRECGSGAHPDLYDYRLREALRLPVVDENDPEIIRHRERTFANQISIRDEAQENFLARKARNLRFTCIKMAKSV